MNIYHTYILLDPRKPGKYTYNNLEVSFLYEPFYVGKGKSPKKRFTKHIWKAKNTKANTPITAKIRKILSLNTKPILISLLPTTNEKESYENEIRFITNIGKKINNGPLTNQLDGGDGTNEKAINRTIKDGILKGSNHPLFGIGHTKETRHKISVNHHDCSGPNASHAKHWEVISPDGIIYNIHGTLQKFCIEHKLSYDTAFKYRNKGKIPNIYRHKSILSTLSGWEIRSI